MSTSVKTTIVSVSLLISNRIVSREIWIKQTLVSFSMLFEKLNRARFIQITLVTILYSIIPILKYITVLTIYTIIITAKTYANS